YTQVSDYDRNGAFTGGSSAVMENGNRISEGFTSVNPDGSMREVTANYDQQHNPVGMTVSNFDAHGEMTGNQYVTAGEMQSGQFGNLVEAARNNDFHKEA